MLLKPMSSSTIGASFPYKCQVEGEMMGSRPIKCMSNVPIKIIMIIIKDSA